MVEGLIRDHVAAGGLAVMTTHQPLALGSLEPRALSVGE
jgi:ABC-type transport system involved in cytochrome c biogenesis ATPase subunit